MQHIRARVGVGRRIIVFVVISDRVISALETVETSSRPRRDVYDAAALVLLVGVFVVVLATFRDYGTTWDESYHFWYAFKVLDYYRSFFHDTTALTSLPISYYGALFDGMTALFAPISPFGAYPTRHLLNAIVGVIGIAGCWKLAREVGGPRVGFFAAALLLLSPTYYGQMFNNPKDIPFAAAYVWSLYYLVRVLPQLPKPAKSDVVKLAIAIGMGLGVRVGELLMLCYLVPLLVVVPGIAAWREQRWGSILPTLAIEASSVLAPVLAISYPIMLLAWPWAQPDPLWRPIADILQFDHHDFPYPTLFDGTYIPAPQLPRIYLPTFFLIQLPELTLLLLASGAVWACLRIWRDRLRLEEILPVSLTAFAALFPIAFAVATHATLFDGLRHFLFVEPPLMVCAALALDVAWRRLQPHRLAFASATAMLAVYLSYHVSIMAALHPDEYVYYNALVGGVPGAAGRFKLDYWANSYREAMLDLVAYLKAHDGKRFATTTYRVSACGPEGSLLPYLPSNFRFVDNPRKADFFIAFTKGGCDKSVPGVTIAEVDRLGTRLSVVLDRRAIVAGKRHPALLAGDN